MTQINAYIGFNGDCRKAMEFYRDCIGGQLNYQTVGESPMGEQCPAGMKDNIVHSALINGPLLIMATDMVGPDGYIRGNNIALCLNCGSEEEIKNFYSNLSAGGKILEQLGRSFWGDLFSCFTDKFGITWMLNYHEEQ
jgi:PhnB protein